MKILIVGVGRLKEDYFRAAEAEYLKRLRAYCRPEVIEAKNEAALLAAIPRGAHIYVLDERGKEQTSRGFAREILDDEQQHGGGAAVVFAIGGPDGHSDAVRKRAKKIIAFGRMTIAHRLVRLVLLEQVYRGFRILRGEPYHR